MVPTTLLVLTMVFWQAERGSDSSLGSIGVDDTRGSKKDLKGKIADMFKKSGSSSRAGR